MTHPDAPGTYLDGQRRVQDGKNEEGGKVLRLPHRVEPDDRNVHCGRKSTRAGGRNGQIVQPKSLGAPPPHTPLQRRRPSAPSLRPAPQLAQRRVATQKQGRG